MSILPLTIPWRQLWIAAKEKTKTKLQHPLTPPIKTKNNNIRRFDKKVCYICVSSDKNFLKFEWVSVVWIRSV